MPDVSCPRSPGGWDWCNDIKQCQPHSPTPGNPQPSGHHRRALKARADSPCRDGLTPCPIKGANGLLADFECLNVKTEPESCGGCASLGEGKDCTAVFPNAFSVGCEDNACVREYTFKFSFIVRWLTCIPHSPQVQARLRQVGGRQDLRCPQRPCAPRLLDAFTLALPPGSPRTDS